MMKDIVEKLGVVKGAVDLLGADPAKPETKVLNNIVALLDELTKAVLALDEDLDVISEQVDAVDEDLESLEEFVYEDLDPFDYDDEDEDDEDDYYDVECPNCGEVISVDREILEEGSLNCPKCNELLEFEIDFDDDEDDADEE